jgi:nucleoside-diphosphate-sugar epimerase
MSSRLRLDLVLNDFVASAVASQKIIVLSDGTPWRPLINIKDMARAIKWALQREASSGGEFLVVNTGTNEWNYQVKDLAEWVARIIPGVSVSINRNAQPDKRSYRVNFDLFKSLAPNHQPQWGLDATVQELQQGLQTLGFNLNDFRNSHYMRLKVLDSLRAKALLNNQLEWTEKPS